MAELPAHRRHRFVVRPDQPLIGVIGHDGDEEVVVYFADDDDVVTEAVNAQLSVQRALKLLVPVKN